MNEDNKQKLTSFLKQLLSDSKLQDDFEFYCISGHTAFHPKVEIIIKFQEVINKYLPEGHQENKLEVQKKKLNEKEISSFINAIIKEEIWNLTNCKDIAVPDETMIHFLIKNGKNKMFETKIWRTCLDKDEKIKKIHTLISKIAPKGPIDL